MHVYLSNVEHELLSFMLNDLIRDLDAAVVIIEREIPSEKTGN